MSSDLSTYADVHSWQLHSWWDVEQSGMHVLAGCCSYECQEFASQYPVAGSNLYTMSIIRNHQCRCKIHRL